jgi:hypothetical protein
MFYKIQIQKKQFATHIEVTFVKPEKIVAGRLVSPISESVLCVCKKNVERRMKNKVKMFRTVAEISFKRTTNLRDDSVNSYS